MRYPCGTSPILSTPSDQAAQVGFPAGDVAFGGDLLEVVGHAVRAERELRSMTLQQLADAMGLPVKDVERIEAGRRTVYVEELPRLCDALDVGLDWLLDLAPARDRVALGLDPAQSVNASSWPAAPVRGARPGPRGDGY